MKTFIHFNNSIIICFGYSDVANNTNYDVTLPCSYTTVIIGQVTGSLIYNTQQYTNVPFFSWLNTTTIQLINCRMVSQNIQPLKIHYLTIGY